jgi:hypothetical protein
VKAVSYLLAFLLGALCLYLTLPNGKVTEKAYQALKASHEKAVEDGLKYRHERDEWHEVYLSASSTADSLRGLRESMRRDILKAPDSTAKILGLHVTKRDSLRCLPLSEFADLVASKIELELADSAALRDSVALNGCENALSYADSAEAVARQDAQAQNKGAKAFAGEVQHLRHARWFYAAGGALVALLMVVGVNSL